MQTLNTICKKCGHNHIFDFVQSVNISKTPEQKEKVLSGELFTWECSVCGEKNLINYPFLYHDPENHLMILETDANIKTESVPDGYTVRQVRSFGQLIEKIKIFDSGLDDIVIEMCKYITLQELSKDLNLKFYGVDGADSQLLFAYPEEDSMQVLSVGFNVYEDCAGIINRNPLIRNSVNGLFIIDQDWIKEFFA